MVTYQSGVDFQITTCKKKQKDQPVAGNSTYTWGQIPICGAQSNYFLRDIGKKKQIIKYQNSNCKKEN